MNVILVIHDFVLCGYGICWMLLFYLICSYWRMKQKEKRRADFIPLKNDTKEGKVKRSIALLLSENGKFGSLLLEDYEDGDLDDLFFVYFKNDRNVAKLSEFLEEYYSISYDIPSECSPQEFIWIVCEDLGNCSKGGDESLEDGEGILDFSSVPEPINLDDEFGFGGGLFEPSSDEPSEDEDLVDIENKTPREGSVLDDITCPKISDEAPSDCDSSGDSNDID